MIMKHSLVFKPDLVFFCSDADKYTKEIQEPNYGLRDAIHDLGRKSGWRKEGWAKNERGKERTTEERNQ